MNALSLEENHHQYAFKKDIYQVSSYSNLKYTRNKTQCNTVINQEDPP